MSLIPDTLTIFITTKIPSYINFIYNSKNTSPSTNTSILMNPIILLKDNITNPNILFDKSLFENQLKEDKLATLPTLLQATKDDYISKNIKTILNVLFAKGKIIYLGDYPFTIHTMSWNGNWLIQHKFSSSLMNIKEYLLANENKSVQENNLLNSLPPEVRTNNDKDYYLQYLTNLYVIKGSIIEPITNKELLINDNDLGINNILKSIKINKLPINLQFIINNYRSDYLIYVSGIYYNLTTDPLILMLFYTDKTYYDKPENYINIPKYISKNAYLEELFNIFKEKRVLLNTTNYNFWNIWKKLSYQQKTIEDLYKKLSDMFVKTPKLNYSNVDSIMTNIELSQKEFYKLFVIYFQSFLNTIHAQKNYYKSTLLFLNELNNVYSVNILKTPLNIENEQLIIQKDIQVFECIVKKFEDQYTDPLTKTISKNIITYYKELYDKYIKIIFNLMKTKAYILFDKIKEDKELIEFYIFQNYTLNLMILSSYEYLKTYINSCLDSYKELLNNNKPPDRSIALLRVIIPSGSRMGTGARMGRAARMGSRAISSTALTMPRGRVITGRMKLSSVTTTKIDSGIAKLEEEVRRLKEEQKKLTEKERLILELTKRIHDLNAESSKTRGKNAELEKDKSDLQKLLLDEDQRKKIIHDENIVLRNKLIELQTELEAEKRKLTENQALLRSSREDYTRVQREKTDLEAVLNRQNETIGRLTSEKATIEERNNRQLGLLIAKNTTIDDLTRRLGVLDARLGELTRDNAQLTGDNAQLTTDNAQLTADKEELTQQLTAIRNELATSQAELLASQVAFDTSQAELLASQQVLDSSQAQLDTLQPQLAASQAELVELQKKYDASQADLAASENRYGELLDISGKLSKSNKSLEEELKRLRLEDEKLRQNVDKLSQRVRILDTQVNDLTEINRQQNEDYKKLQAKNVELQTQNTRLIEEKKDLQTRLQQLLRNQASSITNVADLKRKIAELNKDLQKIIGENDSNKSKLKISEKEIEKIRKGLQAEIDKLKKELIDSASTLYTTQQEYLIMQTKLRSTTTALGERETTINEQRQLITDQEQQIQKQDSRIQSLNSFIGKSIAKDEEFERGYDEFLHSLKDSDPSRRTPNEQRQLITDQEQQIKKQDSRIQSLNSFISKSKAKDEEFERGYDEYLHSLKDSESSSRRTHGGKSILTKIKSLDTSTIQIFGQTFDKIKGVITDNFKKFIDKSIYDNYIVSLIKNIELLNNLLRINPTLTFETFILNIKSIKKQSKLLIKDDDKIYDNFIKNSILTYSMIVLLVYIILIIRFQYLNYNSSCLNYYIIQKEYSTFDYLYTKLLYKKINEDEHFSIPFSHQIYNFNTIDELTDLYISYFSEIIYCNSQICKYSLIYKETNLRVNKLFSNITPQLNEQILIDFCNYTSVDLRQNIIDIVFNNYHFSNDIDNVDFNFLDIEEYKDTLKFQKYLLNIADSGVYFKFLPKEEYISVNNWWLKKINLTTMATSYASFKPSIDAIMDIYNNLFLNEYNEHDNSPYIFLDYVFISTEILIFNNLNYIEMLYDDTLKIKLFHFLKAYFIIEGLDTIFNMSNIKLGGDNYIKKIQNKPILEQKRIHVINNLYNTLFPNYFTENSTIYTELYNSITINSNNSFYERFVNDLYVIFNTTTDLKDLESKLTKIFKQIDYTSIDIDTFKTNLDKINVLNVYCNTNLLKNILIILTYLLKKWIEPVRRKPNLRLTPSDVHYNIYDYIFYVNMINKNNPMTTYYYIIEEVASSYEIGDELINKSNNKIYIILNKLTFNHEVKFQIIDTEYINNPDLILFNSKVQIISLDLTQYTLKNTSQLTINNKYYNQDIRKQITFIYKNKEIFYLVNNLCLFENNDLQNTNYYTRFELTKLDNYIIYFLFYKLVLFNKINRIQYKSSIKNYCLVGLNSPNLIMYYRLFELNDNYCKYIKTYYSNILYFYIINYYIKKGDTLVIENINLLILYKVFKLQQEDIFEKNKLKIESELKYRLMHYLGLGYYRYRGGAGEQIVDTGSSPTINFTTPITREVKKDKESIQDKLSKVELIEKSPFSYFIHIELDLYPGKLSNEESGKISLMKSLYLSCNNTKENIKKNIADIRDVPYKPKSYTPEELLAMNSSFPIDKFIPNYIKPSDKKEEKKKKEKKEEEEEEKKGGGLEQITNPYTVYPSFLNEYLKG